MRRSPVGRRRPFLGELAPLAGRGHAEANVHQGRLGGRVLDGHGTVNEAKEIISRAKMQT